MIWYLSHSYLRIKTITDYILIILLVLYAAVGIINKSVTYLKVIGRKKLKYIIFSFHKSLQIMWKEE
jgi:hypothetical protein